MNELASLFQQSTGAIISDNPITLIMILLSSLIYGLILQYVYSTYFLKNEPLDSSIARSFPIIGPAVAVIFWLIQYSLPLSLGLLGALSFVRFRTPVKRAEDIAFILSVISTSLACAVQKIWVGALIVATLMVYSFIRNRAIPYMTRHNKQAIITFHTNENFETSSIYQKVSAVFGNGAHLVSSSSHDQIKSMVFQVPNATPKDTDAITTELKTMDQDIRVDVFYPSHNLGGY